jgi:hypothetical protein
MVDKDNLASFLLSVKNISWESTFETNDPCESYTNFHNNLKVAIDKCFPLVSKNKKENCGSQKKSRDDNWYI